ncbi:MAG: SpoIIE family protein phosphatase [Spirochaetota bacterium]
MQNIMFREEATDGILEIMTGQNADDTDLNRSRINIKKPCKLFGQVIGKIASSHYYTGGDVKVEDILSQLNNDESVSSLGVVDGSGAIIGIVTRNMFFDILGRPFGWDLHKNKKISTIVIDARRYEYTTNIFSIADAITGDLMSKSDIHYILTDENDRFFGIFNNRDLLMYLSYITQRDIGFAKNVQSSIINEETMYQNKYCEILAGTRMAKDVGGDHYIIKKHNDTNWFISVCDVAGKGISASLVSVLLSGMNYMYDFSLGIKQFVLRLNSFVYSSFKSEKFITGIFADFNEKSGKITVFDAGHSHCFLIRNKKCIPLKSVSENIPIGVSSEYSPAGYSFTMKAEDMLVFLTDGIEEQTNPEGDRYGQEALIGHILKQRSAELKDLKNFIFSDIRAFRKHQTQDDDMTLLMLKYTGGILHA